MKYAIISAILTALSAAITKLAQIYKFGPFLEQEEPMPSTDRTISEVEIATIFDEPKRDFITDLAHAIQSYEGFYPGSRSYRNMNPGNLKYLKQPHTVGHDDKNFATFDSYEHGLQALKTMLRNACTGVSRVYHPEMDLLAFFNTYAPSSDNNNPDAYAKWVAKHMEIPPSTRLRELV